MRRLEISQSLNMADTVSARTRNSNGPMGPVAVSGADNAVRIGITPVAW